MNAESTQTMYYQVQFLAILYILQILIPAYCCCKVTTVAALLLNGGTNTVVKVEDLFNKDSRREQSICSVGGFSKSENIAIIGLLINFHTESAPVILQQEIFAIKIYLSIALSCDQNNLLTFKINKLL